MSGERGGLRGPSRIIGLMLALLGVACAGDDDGECSQGLRPRDPQEWVCQGWVTGLSQAEIDGCCAANQDRGTPAPPDIRSPPLLADLEMKNAFAARQVAFTHERAYAAFLRGQQCPVLSRAAPDDRGAVVEHLLSGGFLSVPSA